MDQARLSRRAVLALIAGAGVAACSPSSDGGDATASPDGDAVLREQVSAQEWVLVSLYDAAIAAQPSLAAELAPIRQQHVDHAAALGSSSPAASSSATPAAPTFSSAAAARSDLSEAEAAASRDRARACQSAVGTEPARLLALIAASEAGHAAYLRGPGT